MRGCLGGVINAGRLGIGRFRRRLARHERCSGRYRFDSWRRSHILLQRLEQPQFRRVPQLAQHLGRDRVGLRIVVDVGIEPVHHIEVWIGE